MGNKYLDEYFAKLSAERLHFKGVLFTNMDEKEIESIARAYRDTVVGAKIDENGWEACKQHWIKDIKVFQAKLLELGFALTKQK